MRELAKNMQTTVEEVHRIVAVDLRKVWDDEAVEEFETNFKNLSQSFKELISLIPESAGQAEDHAATMRNIGNSY